MYVSMTMQIMRVASCGVVAVMSMAAMSPSGTAPKAPNVNALRGLERGQWELRERGVEARSRKPRRICLDDPSRLLQLRHNNGDCRRYVVDDSADHAVVTYECKGAGTGRTDLRVETPRLVQIDSQGIADGAPFSMSIEGRRTGDCQ